MVKMGFGEEERHFQFSLVLKFCGLLSFPVRAFSKS